MSVDFIVWIIFIAMLVIILPFFIKRLMQRKRRKRDAEIQFQNDRVEYATLTKEKLDQIDGEKLVEAVIYSCMHKEDVDDDFFEHMNEEERTIYGIYQLNETVNSSSGLRSFFVSPATKKYVPFIEQYFKNIGAHEAAEIIRNAKILNEIMETENEDLEKEMNSEYATYNFSDFTHEYITLLAGTNFVNRMVEYVKSHEDAFIDQTEGEDEDEGASE